MSIKQLSPFPRKLLVASSCSWRFLFSRPLFPADSWEQTVKSEPREPAELGVRDRTGVSTAPDSRWERRGISKMLFVSKYPANLRPVVSELLFPLVNPLHWREHVFSRTPRESETEPVGTGDVVRSSRERSPQPLAPRCLTSTSRAAVSQLWHLK